MATQEDRQMDKAAATVAALGAWDRMTPEDKAVVRFGMVPFWVAQEHPEIEPRDLAVALFAMAAADGGMIA